MADMYEVITDVAPAETIVIPPKVVLPELRWAAPSGTLAQGDVIEGHFTLTDKDGNVKPMEFDCFRVILKDWPEGNKEILGVFYVNFVVSDLPEVVPPEQQ